MVGTVAFATLLFVPPAHSQFVPPAQSQAVAQAVEDKICILGAAQKLPSIQGLSIASSRTKTTTSPEAAKLLAGSLHSLRAIDELNRTVGFLDDAKLQSIRDHLARGKLDMAFKELVAALTENIRSGLMTEIDVRAAAQSATFAFLCAWHNGMSAQAPTILSIGIAR